MDAETFAVLSKLARAMELLEETIPHLEFCDYLHARPECSCGLWQARWEIRAAQMALFDARKSVSSLKGAANE